MRIEDIPVEVDDREYIEGVISGLEFDSMTGLTTLSVVTAERPMVFHRIVPWSTVCELMSSYVIHKECELIKTINGWAFHRFI